MTLHTVIESVTERIRRRPGSTLHPRHGHELFGLFRASAHSAEQGGRCCRTEFVRD
jgi:hypothetical protein